MCTEEGHTPWLVGEEYPCSLEPSTDLAAPESSNTIPQGHSEPVCLFSVSGMGRGPRELLNQPRPPAAPPFLEAVDLERPFTAPSSQPCGPLLGRAFSQ